MNEHLRSVIVGRLRGTLIRQEQIVTTRMLEVRAQAAAHGHLNSTRCQLELAKVAGEGAHAVATDIWTVLDDCLTKSGVEPSVALAAELKDLYQECLTDKELSMALYMQMSPRLLNTAMAATVEAQLRAESVAARGELDGKIDLFAMTKKNQTSQAAGAIHHTLNIHNSQIGALQTGSGNTATVNFTMQAAERVELAQALQAFAKAVKPAAEDGSASATEILEHVGDGVAELQLEVPKLSRLKGSLVAIAQSLGGIVSIAANAKPAWEMVRGIAAAHGMTLPPFPG